MTYGYVSLPMARRLQEAGVKMETNKCWTIYGDKWIIADSDFPFDQIIPAPSMAELWEWFPSYVNGSDCQYTLRLGKGIYIITLS